MANNEINQVVVRGNTYNLVGQDVNLATIETNANSASKSYAVGDHLVVGNTYCKVIAAISAGDALVIGTNIESAKVGDEITQINASLTANTKKFQFAYDNTKSKYGYTIDGTFYPFSGGGAIYLGQYSADTTIDVSDLGATSADQFVMSCPTNDSWTRTGASGAYTDWSSLSAWCSYTAPTLALNDGILTITVGSLYGRGRTGNSDGGTISNFTGTKQLATNIYFVGDIETR